MTNENACLCCSASQHGAQLGRERAWSIPDRLGRGGEYGVPPRHGEDPLKKAVLPSAGGGAAQIWYRVACVFCVHVAYNLECLG
jgi:hypothetical protein